MKPAQVALQLITEEDPEYSKVSLGAVDQIQPLIELKKSIQATQGDPKAHLKSQRVDQAISSSKPRNSVNKAIAVYVEQWQNRFKPKVKIHSQTPFFVTKTKLDEEALARIQERKRKRLLHNGVEESQEDETFPFRTDQLKPKVHFNHPIAHKEILRQPSQQFKPIPNTQYKGLSYESGRPPLRKMGYEYPAFPNKGPQKWSYSGDSLLEELLEREFRRQQLCRLQRGQPNFLSTKYSQQSNFRF